MSIFRKTSVLLRHLTLNNTFQRIKYCVHPHRLTSLVSLADTLPSFLFRLVANITAHELDDRRLHTAAAIEQWSSASLPLTGKKNTTASIDSSLFPFYRDADVVPRCLLSCSSEELCLELTRAIEAGDPQSASQHASSLARQKASLSIQLSEKSYANGEIRSGVHKIRSACSFSLLVQR